MQCSAAKNLAVRSPRWRTPWSVAQGKQLGRPRIDDAVERRIQAQLRLGKGILKVARELGVGSGTVQRIKQEMKGPFAGMAA
jgi:hypothetical protein